MPIQTLMQDSEQVVRIQSPTWQAEIIVTNNANLIWLQHVPSGLELLRTPPSLETLRQLPEHYGIPLLFPPGRIDGGRFRWNGHDYSFPVSEEKTGTNLHGLLRGQPWSLVGTEEDGGIQIVTMALDFTEDHPYFAGYPHPFRLELTYRFTPEAVLQETRLENLGDKPMPFGLGYHTAFRLPFGKHSEPGENCRFKLATEGGYWERDPDRNLPTGRLLPLPDTAKFATQNGQELNGDLISMLCPATPQQVNGKTFHGAIIESPADNARLIYEIGEEYHLWALWNHGGNPNFVCLEPLTWMSNAPNLDLPAEITGLQALSPGKDWTTNASIRLELT